RCRLMGISGAWPTNCSIVSSKHGARHKPEAPAVDRCCSPGVYLRCIGLARATLNLHWKIAGYNLQRLCYLKVAGVVAF
ncbi:hypothetical protein ACUHMQ_21395, partial [Chitinimonas sp. PSY-7]